MARASGSRRAPKCPLEDVVARFCEAREVPIHTLASTLRGDGYAYGVELRTWVHLFETYELEVVDPSGAEFRVPLPGASLTQLVEAEGSFMVAELVAFFCASALVVQQDEMSFLVSWHDSARGACRVRSFHPDDWGLWPTDDSLSALVYRLLQSDPAPYRTRRFEGDRDTQMQAKLSAWGVLEERYTLAPHLDPAHLFVRTEWLIRLFLNLGRDWARTLQTAAPFVQYEEEKDLLDSEAPQLAAYWLWSHFMFGHDHALDELLALTKAAVNPVVQESRQLVTALRRGEAVRLGATNQSDFFSHRRLFLREAPALVAEVASPLSVYASSRPGEAPEEQVAWAELLEAARDDPKVEEAIMLLEHLKHGGIHHPRPAPVRGGMPWQEALDRLYHLVDVRFRPVILGRLGRAVQVLDSHQDASWGLIVAWSALARDFDEYYERLQALGMQNYGARRWAEFYQGCGRFQDRRATQCLQEGARLWIREVNDWIRSVPVDPLKVLLKRDTLETHEVIQEILEAADFGGANRDIAVAAAAAAGELGSKRARLGLELAVKRRLGRIEDGGRASVIRAYTTVEGAAGLPILRSLFDKAWAEAGRLEGRDAEARTRDAMCFLAGLLRLEPADPVFLTRARESFARAQIGLTAARGRPSWIGAISALFSSIRDAQIRPLLEEVSPFLALDSPEFVALREEALRVYQELR